MYQIIIGKANFDGSPVNEYFNVFKDAESITYEELTSMIVEGLQKNIDLLIDSTIVDSLIQTPLSTAYDLRCLEYTLADQGVILIVTNVGSNVIDSSVNMLVKVVCPITDQFGIPKAVDFPYIDKVDVIDVIRTIADTYDLFTGGIFIQSPISDILAQVPSVEEAGLPNSDLASEGLNILKELGFTIYPIFLND